VEPQFFQQVHHEKLKSVVVPPREKAKPSFATAELPDLQAVKLTRSFVQALATTTSTVVSPTTAPIPTHA
jgi:hypothetical protein